MILKKDENEDDPSVGLDEQALERDEFVIDADRVKGAFMIYTTGTICICTNVHVQLVFNA